MSGNLVERLRSHMGMADMGEVLRDCRAAADCIEEFEASLEAVRVEALEEAAKVAEKRARMIPQVNREAAVALLEALPDAIRALAPAKTGGA